MVAGFGSGGTVVATTASPPSSHHHQAVHNINNNGGVKAEETEVMNGSIVIHSPQKGVPDRRVTVRIYRTSLEHFAVLYPEKVVCNPIGFLNLKNCTVSAVPWSKGPNGKALQVTQATCDADSLFFVVDKSQDFKGWMDAFQTAVDGSLKTASRKKGGSVSLPILEEDEEE